MGMQLSVIPECRFLSMTRLCRRNAYFMMCRTSHLSSAGIASHSSFINETRYHSDDDTNCTLTLYTSKVQKVAQEWQGKVLSSLPLSLRETTMNLQHTIFWAFYFNNTTMEEPAFSQPHHHMVGKLVKQTHNKKKLSFSVSCCNMSSWRWSFRRLHNDNQPSSSSLIIVTSITTCWA